MDKITEKHLAKLEERLINGDRIPIEKSSEWAKSFPEHGGVCLVRENGEICYCGETGNFRTRANDLITTGKHTLRKSIGIEKFSQLPDFVKPESKKFSPNLEKELNGILEANFEITVVPIDEGRGELKKRIIKKYTPFYNNYAR